MFPITNRKPSYTLNIPELSGGVNFRDSVSGVLDTQLTDCLNMWFQNGTLRTRPSVFSGGSYEHSVRFLSNNSEHSEIADIQYSEDIRVTVDGRLQDNANYSLVTVKVSVGTSKTQIALLLMSTYDDEVFEIFSEKIGRISYNLPSKNINTICIGEGNKVYLFASYPDGDIYDIYEISLSERTSRKLEETEIYAPLVMTNGLPIGTAAGSTSGGDSIYGYNLLTRYYEAQYSTVNPDGEMHELIFTLPAGAGEENFEGLTVTAEMTDRYGTKHIYTAVLNSMGIGESAEVNGLRMKVDNVGSVQFLDSEGVATTKMGEDVFIQNNLTITAPGPYIGREKNKVFGMKRSTWFGGNASGIYGGSRCFLGGNSDEAEQALVVWSDLNNPLYFSENNYFYVGNKSQAVTAFGKQSDMLVIFKEHELFGTQYASQSTPTAETLINQEAVDLSTLTAYFPLIQLHGYIGCDCPDSVQLCRNRLVWLCSDGKVYTLTAQNQYNERSVFEVSGVLGKRLQKEGTVTELKNVTSADWNGHYLLFVGSRVYLMDYNSYGYNYIYSYSKSEDAAVHIPWYVWELPFSSYHVFSQHGNDIDFHISESLDNDDNTHITVILTASFSPDTTNSEDRVPTLEYIGNEEYRVTVKDVPIHSVLQTKYFDFGRPTELKSVDKVCITFGYNESVPIIAKCVSELRRNDEHIVTLAGDSAESYDTEYLSPVRFFPYQKGTIRFGINLDCNGKLILGAITLQYKTSGGAK